MVAFIFPSSCSFDNVGSVMCKILQTSLRVSKGSIDERGGELLRYGEVLERYFSSRSERSSDMICLKSDSLYSVNKEKRFPTCKKIIVYTLTKCKSVTIFFKSGRILSLRS